MKIIKLYNCVIVKQDIQLFCSIRIAAQKDKSAEVLNRLTETGTVELVK
jgi:hypothetical protein